MKISWKGAGIRKLSLWRILNMRTKVPFAIRMRVYGYNHQPWLKGSLNATVRYECRQNRP